jgi:hypothetical protein
MEVRALLRKQWRTGARSWAKSRAIGTTRRQEFALKALSFFARRTRANLFSMKALSCVFLR